MYTSMGYPQSFYKVCSRCKNFSGLGSGAGGWSRKRTLGDFLRPTPNFFPDLFLTQRIWVLDAYLVMFGMLRFTPIIFISKLWVSEGLFWACCLLSFNRLLYKTKLLLSVPTLCQICQTLYQTFCQVYQAYPDCTSTNTPMTHAEPCAKPIKYLTGTSTAWPNMITD